MTGGRGCQVRGEGAWSVEMVTWTMSEDRRSGETTGARENIVTGGNRNNSAINDCCFYYSMINAYLVQMLKKMVKFKCISSGGNILCAFKAIIVVN